MRATRVPSLGAHGIGSNALIGERHLLESGLPELYVDSMELVVALCAFRDVDGMHHDCSGDDVVTQGHKHHGAILLLHDEPNHELTVPGHGADPLGGGQARPSAIQATPALGEGTPLLL